MIGRCLAGIGLAMLVPMTPASGQQAYAWSDVDCTRSRIAPLAGATCRTTNVAAGGDVAGGPGRRHSVRGTTAHGYVAVFMSEGIGSGAHVLTRKSTLEYLKLIDKRATDGSGWSDRTTYDGADYHTFVSSEGEACVGFRKLGDVRSFGYAWMMNGLLCAPKGQMLQRTQIGQFIDGMHVR
jgi:hypothetical protein